MVVVEVVVVIVVVVVICSVSDVENLVWRLLQTRLDEAVTADLVTVTLVGSLVGTEAVPHLRKEPIIIDNMSSMRINSLFLLLLLSDGVFDY